MAIEHLDHRQARALIEEMTSTRNLLAYGVRAVRTGAFIDTTRDPILTLLSIGVEKLYKLTLGLIALDRDHQWRSRAEMKKHSHDLLAMHASVIGELQTRTATQTVYVRELLAEVEADDVLEAIIAALSVYGSAGRFYNLDELGGHSQPIDPRNAWDEVDEAARNNPHVNALFQQAVRDPGDAKAWKQFTLVTQEHIASSIEGLWTAIAVFGRNRTLGETGRTFGIEVHPDAVGRQ